MGDDLWAMPYEVVWEPRGVHVRVWGAFSDEDLLRSNEEIAADPRCESSMDYQIVDLLEVDSVPLKTESVRIAAQRDRLLSERRPDVRVAIVARNEVIVGLSRLYELAGEPTSWTTEIFPDLPSARRWARHDT